MISYRVDAMKSVGRRLDNKGDIARSIWNMEARYRSEASFDHTGQSLYRSLLKSQSRRELRNMDSKS